MVPNAWHMRAHRTGRRRVDGLRCRRGEHDVHVVLGDQLLGDLGRPGCRTDWLSPVKISTLYFFAATVMPLERAWRTLLITKGSAVAKAASTPVCGLMYTDLDGSAEEFADPLRPPPHPARETSPAAFGQPHESTAAQRGRGLRGSRRCMSSW